MGAISPGVNTILIYIEMSIKLAERAEVLFIEFKGIDFDVEPYLTAHKYL